MSSVPTLLLVYNRPSHLRILINRLREIKPKHIYVSADGPRANKAGDQEKCLETRSLLKEIDWECTIITHFSEQNRGCKNGVDDGITWFFEQVEYGIILECDCIPSPSFFPFCEELLIKYKDTLEVSQIAALNPLGKVKGTDSYFFSNHSLIWGWATWRRSWMKRDLSMSFFPNYASENRIEDYVTDKRAQKYILEKWQKSFDNQIDTWDYQWAFANIYHRGLTIVPNKNQVVNIGFDKEATHTVGRSLIHMNHHKLSFPLIHPTELKADKKNDQKIFYITNKTWFRLWLRGSFFYQMLQKIKNKA